MDQLLTWSAIGVGTVVVILVIFAIASIVLRRRRRRATLDVEITTEALGGQPYLRTEPVKVQHKAALSWFKKEYEVGTEVSVSVSTGQGERKSVPMRVARYSRRSVNAPELHQVVLFAYLEPYEGSELPITLPVDTDTDVSRMLFDAEGVTGFDPGGRRRWHAAWEDLSFASSGYLSLQGPDGVMRVRTDRGNGELAEALCVKYGTWRESIALPAETPASVPDGVGDGSAPTQAKSPGRAATQGPSRPATKAPGVTAARGGQSG